MGNGCQTPSPLRDATIIQQRRLILRCRFEAAVREPSSSPSQPEFRPRAECPIPVLFREPGGLDGAPKSCKARTVRLQ